MITFDTNRLKFFPFTEVDLGEYFKIISEKSIRDALPLASTRSKQDAMILLNTYINVDFEKSFAFKLTLKSNGKIVGAILGSGMSSTTLDVSFLTAKQYRDNGYMTEALNKFVDYIAAYSDYKTISFRVNPKNLPAVSIIKSTRALRKVTMGDKEIWQIEL